ncbi:HK97 gp10 family phage protein [Fusobacterium varium]|jgi:putative cell wall-binding protein
MDGFSSRDLENLEREVLRLAKKYPKETKKFLQNQGNKLKARVKKKAKSKLKEKSGNYLKGFKRGKVYKYNQEEDTVRVYNNMSHAHLIEHGHIIKDKTGKEHGFKKGYRILEEARTEFQDEFVKNADGLMDEIIKNGGF